MKRKIKKIDFQKINGMQVVLVHSGFDDSKDLLIIETENGFKIQPIYTKSSLYVKTYDTSEDKFNIQLKNIPIIEIGSYYDLPMSLKLIKR